MSYIYMTSYMYIYIYDINSLSVNDLRQILDGRNMSRVGKEFVCNRRIS